MTALELASCLAVSSFRTRPERDSTLLPELLPIRIPPLEVHLSSNPSFWSPSKEQFSLGGRTPKAIFFRWQHWCAKEPAQFTRVWRSSTLCSPHRCWRSRTSMVDLSRLSFQDSPPWQFLVPLLIRICPLVMHLSEFR